ncbi:MAG: AAA family ATPase [Candidatus Aenigmatarchaeota archaeon]
MARLERIAIQGFKSFRKKVSIPFPPGLSIIIGPNGSGKTNIVDAINFVIGRTSSRLLRAKKATDLIYHGYKKKPPAEEAKVALFFDNSDKSLPFDEPVVSVSRRLNKAGISTYRLNGRIATRQQMLDVLVQIGLRPDGYNIIQQGEVTQIIEMDAIERRKIIDSLAGISEYEEKKAHAEKELAATQQKIRDAELVLNEKQTILEKLRAERAAAVEWQELQKELELIKAACLIKEKEELEAELSKVLAKIEEKENEQEELAKRLDEIEKKIREGEKGIKDISKRVSEINQTLEAERRLSRFQAELEFKRSRLEVNKKEIERLRLLDSKLTSRSALTFEGIDGVLGKVSDLLSVSPEYQTAFEVAVGGHLDDWVVESLDTAIKCIEMLKRTKAGQARFLPLDHIRPQARRPLPNGAIAWLSDIITAKPKFKILVEWIGNQTACVKDIYTAKEIAKVERVRMVTLEGDLFEPSGAVTGGWRQKRSGKEILSRVKELEEENRNLEDEIKRLEKEIANLSKRVKPTEELKLARIDEGISKLREERKEIYEKRLSLQQDIGRLNIQKTKIEVKLDNLRLQIPEIKGENPFLDTKLELLKRRDMEINERLKSLGPINMRAIQDFEFARSEFDKLKEKLDKIIEERNSIEATIQKIEERRRETFMSVFENVSRHFKETYKELTGGEAELQLENNDINSGLLIKASPPGKKLVNIDSMSTGEKTVTAFAFLFAIQRHKPAPFYVLDEADAALDKLNSERVVNLLKKYSKIAQMIFISHNDAVIKEADQVYGISMEDGESKVIAIKLPEN